MDNKLNVDRVEDLAAAWILKRESPAWSAGDEADLNRWLAASTNHRVAYVRLRSVWREASRLKIVNAGSTQGDVPPRGAIGDSPFFARRRSASGASADDSKLKAPASAFRLAAGILLAATFGIAAYFWPGGTPSYRTAVGGLATVPMDDGSKITLNTDSEITLAVTGRERRVTLIQGEAFFEVAQDPLRPFVVHAGGQRVVAVGTKFAVRLKPESVQVIVTEGRVRLENKPSLLLTPGTVVNAKDEKIAIEQEPLAQVEQTLSWRTGYVVLRRTRLGEAIAEFNRYNRRQLVIDDPALAGITVGGNFQSGNIDGFVRLLQEGFDVKAEERGNRIVLTRRPPGP